MSDLAIRVEKLGKQYRIGATQPGYRTFREALIDGVTIPFKRLRGLTTTAEDQTIWALRDATFEVRRGEVLGIIGRNGAGKTTLLKILSRITEPTEGCAELYGRVGSLLEVGTGFHPELSGRENIYLNGAILGMKRSEIQHRFDEIVAFAEVEKFIDTPVKHYSSGMYMRLAFAVAAHLEPDILLVDEVLAVGDAAFQKKCLGKMRAVAREGRTVLFVSHNLPAVQRLCEKGHLLETGRIIASGDAATVVDTYYKLTTNEDNSVAEVRNVPEGTVRFLRWHVSTSSTGDPYSSYTGEPFTIELRLAVRRILHEANFGIALWADDGTLVWAMRSLDDGRQSMPLPEGLYALQFGLPQFPLRPGTYQILASANDLREGSLDAWYARPKLQIFPKNESGLPVQWQGLLNLSGEFKCTPVSCHAAGSENDK